MKPHPEANVWAFSRLSYPDPARLPLVVITRPGWPKAGKRNRVVALGPGDAPVLSVAMSNPGPPQVKRMRGPSAATPDDIGQGRGFWRVGGARRTPEGNGSASRLPARLPGHRPGRPAVVMGDAPTP